MSLWRKPPKETEKTIREANKYMTEMGGLTGSIFDPEFLQMLLAIILLPFRLVSTAVRVVGRLLRRSE